MLTSGELRFPFKVTHPPSNMADGHHLPRVSSHSRRNHLRRAPKTISGEIQEPPRRHPPPLVTMADSTTSVEAHHTAPPLRTRRAEPVSSSSRRALFTLEGKVALITGGASGIGEATARLFVKHGAKVVVADVQDNLGQAVCRSLGSNDTVTYIHCDVTCESNVETAVDMAVSKYGKLDIMFNNAGVFGSLESRILHSDSENFKKVNDVNVFGAFLGAKHAARVMIPAKKGCIIFAASAVTEIGDAFAHGYVASKHAVVGMAKNLSVELGEHGIRVNCVSPFAVASPMVMRVMGTMEKKEVEELVAATGTLKGAVLEAEDIAEAVVYT